MSRRVKYMGKQVWKGLAAGAVGGLAASFAMNQFQALWSTAAKSIAEAKGESQQKDGESEPSTVKTAQAIARYVCGRELEESEKKPAGSAVHYGFGMLVGALYGTLAQVMPVSKAAYGTAYGSAVWLSADEIALPAFGLAGPPRDSPPSVHVNALASHLVYGFVTDLVRRGIMKIGETE